MKRKHTPTSNKHDTSRDGQGDAQTENWENWGSKGDANKHERDE